MKTKYLIPCLLLFSVVALGQTDYLRVKYDKFDDRTSVTLWQMPLAQGAIGALPRAHGTEHAELRLTLSHSHNGRANPQPPGISEHAYLSFSSESILGLSRPPKLILLIDNERHLIQTEWPERPNGHDAKRVTAPLTYGMLTEIAEAKKIEGRLGIVEFHLVTWHQDEIRRFIVAVGDVK